MRLTASTATPPVAGSTQICERTSVCVPYDAERCAVSAGGSVMPISAMNAVK